jgi:serine/threonine protein kinase
MHEKGMVHRDLHAGNILIEGDPTDPKSLVSVHLIDFGLSHIYDGPAPRIERLQDLNKMKNPLFREEYMALLDPRPAPRRAALAYNAASRGGPARTGKARQG